MKYKNQKKTFLQEDESVLMSTRKNTLLMAVYEILIYIAPLITAPYIARVLGTSGTGIYSYTFSIASYFIISIQLGVSIYGRREIASKLTKEERTKSFWSIFACLFISFFISSVAFFVVLSLSSNEIKQYLIWQYLMLIAGWLDIGWFFFGIEEFKLAVSRNIVVKVFSLVLVFLLIHTENDTLKYVILMAATNVISVLVMWIALPKYLNKGKICIQDILQNLKPLLILAVPVISIQLYSLTDKVFLGLMMDLDSVGIYENMYKLSRVPVALITTMGTVLLPRITNMLAMGKEKETYKYIDKSLSLTLIIASACSFGLISISPWLVPWYYGTAFISGVPVLQVLSLVLFIIAWGNIFRNQFIIPRKLDSIYLVSVVAAAVINIGLNLLFIPIWGVVGAAIASVLSELVVCIYQCFRIKDSFDFLDLVKRNIQYIIAGAIMCVLVNIMGRVLDRCSIATILLLTISGCIIYILTVYIFETITKTKVMKNEIHNAISKIHRK